MLKNSTYSLKFYKIIEINRLYMEYNHIFKNLKILNPKLIIHEKMRSTYEI